ncbi:MAG: N-acetyltransferase [Kofleriaceae bacterium]|nr:N-acetyltransferase [Kofleriaceae bacterium]
MSIRPARVEDFEAIAAITNHYIATTAIHFGYEPVTAGELVKYFGGKHPWFVTTSEAGEVLGYAKAGTWRDRAAYAWTCELGLYIADGARGRGLGRALYDVLLADLEQRGFRSAVAGITMPNAASVALHERCGFTRVGTFVDAGWKLGAWHAVEFWQKPLARVQGEPPVLAEGPRH